MQKITAIIPCYNEETHIQAVIESVSWADEIMVVDSFSTDNTVQIAKKYTDFILQRKYINSANQKNWAIPQATHDWIVLVDADERVTPQLKTEIQALLSNPNELADAYWINRRNYFMGKRLNYLLKGDKVIRLFKKTCRYQSLNVHAEIITEGLTVHHLKEELHHYTFKSIDHYMNKLHRYAAWSAKDHAVKTKRVTLYHLLIKPFFRFFKHYILERGILDGRIGFILSSVLAWTVFLRYWKILEMKYRKSEKNQHLGT